MIHRNHIFLTFLCLGVGVSKAIDDGHFYRAGLWRGLPKSTKPFLSSFHVFFGSGSTSTSFNAQGEEVPLLLIDGPENLPALGIDPGNCKKLVVPATFTAAEVQFEHIVNFDYGFFGHIFLPVRKLTLNLATAPTRPSCDEAFDALAIKIAEAGSILSSTTLSSTGPGDLSIIGGWAHSYQSSSMVDFVDTTVEAGILFPTGSSSDDFNGTDFVSLGHGGFFGVPLIADISLGFLNWLTIGAYIQAVLFIDNLVRSRIRTDPLQEGLVRFDSTIARVKSGTMWDALVYAKADHIMRGFSATIGFSYYQKNRSFIHPLSKKLNQEVINGDPLLQGWNMRTVNFSLEYDWSDEDNPYGPILAFMYNHIISGRRIFNNSTASGFAGANFQWRF